jgi:hypothetical protein
LSVSALFFHPFDVSACRLACARTDHRTCSRPNQISRAAANLGWATVEPVETPTGKLTNIWHCACVRSETEPDMGSAHIV